MDNKKIDQKVLNETVQIDLLEVALKVSEILEKNDGRSFEEKKHEAILFMENQQESLLAKARFRNAVDNEIGREKNKVFWSLGEKIKCNESILIRKVEEQDKDGFISLQKENFKNKIELEGKVYQNLLWQGHISDKLLSLTIEVDNEYAGYCGINNLGSNRWEIAIELLERYRYKGIGSIAIKTMIEKINSRLGVNNFTVKIAPDNYASQRLFEKLGAIPVGIAEYLLHDEKDKKHVEESMLGLIDEKLLLVADKFNVEPKKLLSHVLEYELINRKSN